ncbi:MAG: TetR/AcrR family transcriptional regulator; helix-turn-helix transcriptional regulator [Alphaproteobacteria bacterium]|nr:TetR/AcrR family transcriptional regulator; helix-turn-helix transcriptional regulator [Alphaproteobacteria bacterium]MBU2191628.1 TetR/AcrR family transcriptional regulator; helix-turn-helix transcriptional regulator [Alphaproteobacteria bacterium]
MTTDVVGEKRSGLRADARRNRDRVLQTAMRHFGLHGISASLDEIAREAGVGAGTLYRHFPSREALLAAALRDRQTELLAISRETRGIANADAALARWLQALQDYLRTFNGLPAPVLAAVKEQASPLALSCDTLVSITAEFLERAQREGNARATVTANDLFLGALGIAWVLNRADTCGTSLEALNTIFAHGYLDRRPDGQSVVDDKPEEITHG